jgi:hypothetical protein
MRMRNRRGRRCRICAPARVARMERSAIQEQHINEAVPDLDQLHPVYDALHAQPLKARL